jgi:hypothetical protein
MLSTIQLLARGNRLRTFVVLCCLVSLAGLGSRVWADDSRPTSGSHQIVVEGSTPTPRQQTDQYHGSVYIYAGGFCCSKLNRPERILSTS